MSTAEGWQMFFNIALILTSFFGGWVLKRIYSAIDRLDDDVRALPERYVAKDDFYKNLDRVEIKLDRILDKLDQKADK
jgi:hypothetical protein